MRFPLPLIALVVLAAVLVAPASAELTGLLPDKTYTRYDDRISHVDFNAYDPAGEVIGEIVLLVNPDTTVNFVLYSYNQEIAGGINRTSTGANSESVTYWIGDQVSGPHDSSTLFGLVPLGEHKYRLCYGAGSDKSLKIWLYNYNRGIGWENPSYAIPDVIPRASIDSSQDIHVTVTTADTAAMRAKLSEVWDLGQNWLIQFISIGKGMASGIYLVVSLGWYLFQKIFIENFYLALGLYEIIGAAYAANTSRDIFQFFKKFYQYNLALAQFMYRLIDSIFSIVARIIDALKIW